MQMFITFCYKFINTKLRIVEENPELVSKVVITHFVQEGKRTSE
jgi:hypothetical protein